MLPLKTVVPYVIRVDRSTGETEIVTALKGPQPHTYDDAVNRYFIAQYVRLREGWLNDAARENAYTVMLMSQQAESGRYLAGGGIDQQERAIERLWRRRLVSITIRSISYLSPTVAQVRFSKIITMGQNAPSRRTGTRSSPSNSPRPPSTRRIAPSIRSAFRS
jgi:type IV secretion system protein VirB8